VRSLSRVEKKKAAPVRRARSSVSPSARIAEPILTVADLSEPREEPNGNPMDEGKPYARGETPCERGGFGGCPRAQGGTPKMSGKRRKKGRIGPETIAPRWG
jgi:hypothetical protein